MQRQQNRFCQYASATWCIRSAGIKASYVPLSMGLARMCVRAVTCCVIAQKLLQGRLFKWVRGLLPQCIGAAESPLVLCADISCCTSRSTAAVPAADLPCAKPLQVIALAGAQAADEAYLLAAGAPELCMCLDMPCCWQQQYQQLVAFNEQHNAIDGRLKVTPENCYVEHHDQRGHHVGQEVQMLNCTNREQHTNKQVQADRRQLVGMPGMK